MPDTLIPSSLCVYLTFNGNCKEAMTLYHECLGGDLSFVTLSESPLAKYLPAAQGKYVLLAQLKHPLLTLLATDMVPDEGLVKGNSVSLYLNCSDLLHMQQVYDTLSEKSERTSPIHQTFFGEWFADITDRFGIQWLLYYDPHNTITQ